MIPTVITNAHFMAVHRILPELVSNSFEGWINTKFQPVKGKCTFCVQHNQVCRAKLKNGRYRCTKCRQYGKTCDGQFMSFAKLAWVLAHVYRACDEPSPPSTPSEAIAKPPSSPIYEPRSPPQYDFAAQQLVDAEHYNPYPASSAPFLPAPKTRPSLIVTIPNPTWPTVEGSVAGPMWGSETTAQQYVQDPRLHTSFAPQGVAGEAYWQYKSQQEGGWGDDDQDF